MRHFETEHPHFHIVYNRVNLHGKSINESKNFDRSHKATKAIKEKYDLTFSPKKKLYEDAKAEMKVKRQILQSECRNKGDFSTGATVSEGEIRHPSRSRRSQAS